MAAGGGSQDDCVRDWTEYPWKTAAEVMNDMPYRLFIVVPCYKEEAVLPETARRLREKLSALVKAGRVSLDSRVLFVNDGSLDGTWAMIQALCAEPDSPFAGVNLSRNRGHQNALLAGLSVAARRADVTVSMDADLQDDVDAVDLMLDQFDAGCDVVYGVRSSRDKDTAFKRLSAEGFYRVMRLLGVDIVFNHADYRLMSRRAVEGLMEFPEVNLFLRGMVPLVGYRSATVEYERRERFAGESKYPLRKMLKLAFDGITSFSIKPIRMVLGVGLLLSAIGVAILIWSLIVKLRGLDTAGWTSIMGSIWIIGGIQMLSIGLIGEYIGKIYAEVKRRPRFIIEDEVNTGE